MTSERSWPATARALRAQVADAATFSGFTAIDKAAAFTGAAAIAAFAFMVCMRFKIPVGYSDFIAGNLAWSAEGKVQDLLAAPLFIAAFGIAALMLALVIQMERRWQADKRTALVSGHILLWSAPALAACGALLLDGRVDPNLFALPAYGLLFIALSRAATRYFRSNLDSAAIKSLSAAPLILLLFALAPLEFSLAHGRLPFAFTGGVEIARDWTEKWSVVLASGGFLAALISAAAAPRLFLRALPFTLLIAQLGLSLFYFTLYPARLLQPDGILIAYQTTFALKALVVGLIAVTAADVLLKFLRRRQAHSIAGLFSPLAVFALLVALKVGITSAPQVSPDDYHFGERLVGLSAYLQGAIPYADYIPAHGLIDNDLTKLISTIFYDGTAASMGDAGRLTLAILALRAFLSVHRLTGSLALAFASTFFLGGRLAWFFLVPFLCLWFDKRRIEAPSKWLAFWILTAPIAILGAPPQGVIVVAASALIAIFVVIRTGMAGKSADLRPAAIAGAALALAAVVTPLGSMLAGAVQYVVENGAINQTAYGTPWEYSWTQTRADAGAKTGFLFELIRISWVAVAIVIAILACARMLRYGKVDAYSITMLAALAIIVLLVPYSMGRIDPRGVARSGQIAIFSWTFLMPMVMWSVVDERARGAVVASMVLAAASLNFAPHSLSYLVSSTVQRVSTKPLTDGASAGLPRLGLGHVDPQHFERLTKLNEILERRLPEGAAYLDLTSRNAHYFYFDKLPPIPVTAPYNMASIRQQSEAVRRLRESPPPLALLSAENRDWDGGGLASRNPLLFRYVVDTYSPFSEGGFIFGRLRSDADSSSKNSIPIAIRDLTDENWINGIHRREPAVITNDDSLLSSLSVGSELLIGTETRRITRLWPEGGALWFEGGPLTIDSEGKRPEIQARISDDRRAVYEAELFQNSFSPRQLKLLPYSWGRSHKSLRKRMTQVMMIDGTQAKLTQISLEANAYRSIGADPFVTFDLTAAELSGRDAGLLKFEFGCDGQREQPQLQVFFWGDAQKGPTEISSLRFEGGDGVLILPLDVSAHWLMLDRVAGLRIDLNNPQACQQFSMKDLALYQRRFSN